MTCAITMYMLDRRTACRFDNGLRMIHSRHSPIVCVYMYEACRYLWFFALLCFWVLCVCEGYRCSFEHLELEGKH